MDCEVYENRAVCGLLGVSALPTLLLFRKGRFYAYESERREQDPIEDWLDEWHEGEMEGLVKGTPIPRPPVKKRVNQPAKKRKLSSSKKQRLHTEL